MVVKSIRPDARASATGVSFYQKTQQEGAYLRPEKLLFIGNYQAGKNVEANSIYSGTGNADDIGTMFGFGSPLHRMALKAYQADGAKCDVLFLPVPEIETGATHKVAILVDGVAANNATLYLRFKEQIFEAAADIASKISTVAQENPALDSKGKVLNAFNWQNIPFTIKKGASAEELLLSIKEQLDEYVELPFNVKVNTDDEDAVTLELESKVKGESAKFEVEIVNTEYQKITSSIYGIDFVITVTEQASGCVDLTDYIENITEELGVTRVCSQFNDDNALNVCQDYFQRLREAKIAQYVVCYTAKEFPESTLVAGTVDIDSLIAFANERKDDAVNIQLFGDYGLLRPLSWELRDKLLKSGISNLRPLASGGYEIGDICTFYHQKSNQKTLYAYDRDICCLGNIAYYLMQIFEYDPNWKSVILVGNDDITTNPKTKRVIDFVDKLNSAIRVLGKAGILANIEKSIGYTIAEIDSTNPDRINLNSLPELSSINRIVDISNIIGFNYGG